MPDRDPLGDLAQVRLEDRGVRRDLVVDRGVVQHGDELLVRKLVTAPAHDQRAVEPAEHARGPVVGAHGVIVVVPVARAARPEPAAGRGHHLVRAPDVGPRLARVVERGVQRCAVRVGAVVDAVRMDGEPLVGRVDQGDLERVALVHLQDRPGDRGLAALETVAVLVVAQRLGVDGDLPGGSRGAGGLAVGGDRGRERGHGQPERPDADERAAGETPLPRGLSTLSSMRLRSCRDGSTLRQLESGTSVAERYRIESHDFCRTTTNLSTGSTKSKGPLWKKCPGCMPMSAQLKSNSRGYSTVRCGRAVCRGSATGGCYQGFNQHDRP